MFMPAQLEEFARLVREPVLILTYRLRACHGATGQTVGADGSGDFTIVYYGDIASAEEDAAQHLKSMDRLIAYVLVRNESRYAGKPVLIRALSAKGESDG
jgi:hypothetical protein